MWTLFVILITLQFVATVFHDMLDIPGWTHGKQVQALIGPKKFWIATGINALFPGLAVGFAYYYLTTPAPPGVMHYWVIYCSIALCSVIGMWYIPYFFGTNERTKREYAAMYAGTYQFLPPRGDNPRPNLFHLYLHAVYMLSFALIMTIWIRGL